MKKLLVALFLMSAFVYQVSAQDFLEDKIELSREGGTTRATDLNRMMMSMSTVDPVSVDAFKTGNSVVITVENYRGGAWIEIVGEGGTRSSYFQVYDMGFEVIHLSGLRAGTYTIRITLDSAVFTGTFNKGRNKYGHRRR